MHIYIYIYIYIYTVTVNDTTDREQETRDCNLVVPESSSQFNLFTGICLVLAVEVPIIESDTMISRYKDQRMIYNVLFLLVYTDKMHTHKHLYTVRNFMKFHTLFMYFSNWKFIFSNLKWVFIYFFINFNYILHENYSKLYMNAVLNRLIWALRLRDWKFISSV